MGAATRGRKNKKNKKTQEPSGLSAEMELRSHFSGKRSAKRRCLELEVTVCGIMDNFPAQSIDVSKSGMLLQITDTVFADSDEDLASFAFKVQQHFQQGADILIEDHRGRVETYRQQHCQPQDIPCQLAHDRLAFRIPGPLQNQAVDQRKEHQSAQHHRRCRCSLPQT